MPSFDESCRLFEWSYKAVYAQWAPQQGAVRYTVKVTERDGATVYTRKTRQTFHLITGLQLVQRYNVTVTAFRANKANSKIRSIRCFGETGEDYCSVDTENFCTCTLGLCAVRLFVKKRHCCVRPPSLSCLSLIKVLKNCIIFFSFSWNIWLISAEQKTHCKNFSHARREGGVGGSATPGLATFGGPAVGQKYKVRQNVSFWKKIKKFSPRQKVSPGPAVALDGSDFSYECIMYLSKSVTQFSGKKTKMIFCLIIAFYSFTRHVAST